MIFQGSQRLEEVQLEPALVTGKRGSASFLCATSATEASKCAGGTSQTGPEKDQLWPQIISARR